MTKQEVEKELETIRNEVFPVPAGDGHGSKSLHLIARLLVLILANDLRKEGKYGSRKDA